MANTARIKESQQQQRLQQQINDLELHIKNLERQKQHERDLRQERLLREQERLEQSIRDLERQLRQQNQQHQQHQLQQSIRDLERQIQDLQQQHQQTQDSQQQQHQQDQQRLQQQINDLQQPQRQPQPDSRGKSEFSPDTLWRKFLAFPRQKVDTILIKEDDGSFTFKNGFKLRHSKEHNEKSAKDAVDFIVKHHQAQYGEGTYPAVITLKGSLLYKYHMRKALENHNPPIAVEIDSLWSYIKNLFTRTNRGTVSGSNQQQPFPQQQQQQQIQDLQHLLEQQHQQFLQQQHDQQERFRLQQEQIQQRIQVLQRQIQDLLQPQQDTENPTLIDDTEVIATPEANTEDTETAKNDAASLSEKEFKLNDLDGFNDELDGFDDELTGFDEPDGFDDEPDGFVKLDAPEELEQCLKQDPEVIVTPEANTKDTETAKNDAASLSEKEFEKMATNLFENGTEYWTTANGKYQSLENQPPETNSKNIEKLLKKKGLIHKLPNP